MRVNVTLDFDTDIADKVSRVVASNDFATLPSDERMRALAPYLRAQVTRDRNRGMRKAA